MSKYQITIDDMIGPYGYSKNFVRNAISGYQGKPVNVKISSLGGSVDDALDIRQQFVDHGDVTAYIFGFTASAATIIAMGAKKVCMSKYAMFLVHKCSNWVDAWGQYNADQIQELIEQLKENKLQNDKIDLVLASLYATKCKKSINDIADILKDGRWLTADEAKEIGFVDEIVEEDENEKVDYAALNTKLNAFGLTPVTVSNKDEKPEDKTPGLLANIVQKLDNLIGRKADNIQPAQQNNTTIKMKEDYKNVNSILNVKGFEFDKDGKVTLTEDQVKTINDAIKAKDDSITEKDTKIKDLNTQIENLNKEPGDITNHVEGNEGEDGKSGKITSRTMYDAVKNYI